MFTKFTFRHAAYVCVCLCVCVFEIRGTHTPTARARATCEANRLKFYLKISLIHSEDTTEHSINCPTCPPCPDLPPASCLLPHASFSFSCSLQPAACALIPVKHNWLMQISLDHRTRSMTQRIPALQRERGFFIARVFYCASYRGMPLMPIV